MRAVLMCLSLSDYFINEFVESLRYPVSGHCRSFEAPYVPYFANLLDFGVVYEGLSLVNFICENHNYWALLCVVLDHLEPVVEAIERLPLRDVKDEDDTVARPEIRGRDRVICFLPGRVPKVNLIGQVIDYNLLATEIGAVC